MTELEKRVEAEANNIEIMGELLNFKKIVPESLSEIVFKKGYKVYSDNITRVVIIDFLGKITLLKADSRNHKEDYLAQYNLSDKCFKISFINKNASYRWLPNLNLNSLNDVFEKSKNLSCFEVESLERTDNVNHFISIKSPIIAKHVFSPVDVKEGIEIDTINESIKRMGDFPGLALSERLRTLRDDIVNANPLLGINKSGLLVRERL